MPTSSNPHHIQHWLRLLPEEGCYCLSLESAVPLFTVALHATCHLQLLDVPGNVAIVSRSPPDPQAPSSTLATYRWAPEMKGQHAGCHKSAEGGFLVLDDPPHVQQLRARGRLPYCNAHQCPCPSSCCCVGRLASSLPPRCQDSTSRVSIKFRAAEGKPGVLTAYPIPQNPPKVGQCSARRPGHQQDSILHTLRRCLRASCFGQCRGPFPLDYTLLCAPVASAT